MNVEQESKDLLSPTISEYNISIIFITILRHEENKSV